MALEAISARERYALLMDSWTELFAGVVGGDPLDFPGYAEKMAAQREKTGLDEAFSCAVGSIGGVRAVVGVLDCAFFMGSMGVGVGEKVTLAIEYARDHRLPLILFSASGGARMQEFQAAGGLYISVLTNPTTGGVIASFASLGDIMLAEPDALIGFAGPRVIEQTIGQRLPEGFQRSEFQQAHGFVDQIVERSELREVICRLLRLHGYAPGDGKDGDA